IYVLHRKGSPLFLFIYLKITELIYNSRVIFSESPFFSNNQLHIFTNMLILRISDYVKLLAISKGIIVMQQPELIIKTTSELTPLELLTIMQERTKVFVVEQRCAYQEIDEADFNAHHVYLTLDNNLLAYTRIIKDSDNAYIRFGRVLVPLA